MSKYTIGSRGFTTNSLLGDVRKEGNFIMTIQDVTDGTAIELVIDKAFIPYSDSEVLTLTHGNDSKTFAGRVTWTAGSITIHDTVSQAEADALVEWRTKVYNPKTGAVGLASEYKKLATITEFAGDFQYQREWQFPVWPSQLQFGNLDSASSNLKQITVVFQMDPPETNGPTTYTGYTE